LNEAQLDLASSYEREKNLEADAKRAASDARASREHADTARQRVETVREMLRNWKNSATSAETVVHTAKTEAKISDQRASETEARAKLAAANAEKDRARAELETQKEERLEHEAAELHEQSVEATKLAKQALVEMDRAASRLHKLHEQIKLIEKSTQYQQEVSQGGDSTSNDDGMSERTPRHVSRFVAKHAAKLQQTDECRKAITEANDEHDKAEKKKRITQEAFEEKARKWKVQADVASKARKQADRTMAIVEELEEHAEEEREAAKLRKVAHEKAASNVQHSDSYRSSVQAQLIEAERASAEAASKAVENRNLAERLAKEAAGAKDHSVAFSTLESRKLQHQEALRHYEVATEKKQKAEAKVAEAKRVLDRSSDLVMSGKRSAALDIQRINAEKHGEGNAVLAYNKAVLSRKQATHALSLVKLAETTFDERKASFSHAREYKEKHDKVARISVALATMTLLDSHKFKYWEKSHTLPCTQMHSFSQSHFLNMLDVSTQVNNLLKFSRNHIVRTFPSLKVTEHMSHVNINPVSQWAVGCQLVSMNFQSADENLLANDGRFRMNGSSGYVLKPRYLLKDNQPAEKPQHWKFEILSGRCLPKPESAGRRGLPVGLSSSSHVNPVVRVSLYDGVIGKDSLKVLFTSEAAERNGLNPVWETGQDFEVSVERPSIAVLLFTVWDKRGDGSLDFIAGAAMPVSCLREGYRTVSLFDSLHTKCGPYSFASLLARAHKLS
jgi:phosphatidylinositol phospholipase C delta